MTLEIPTKLPLAYLSVSSVNLYLSCPLAWKRRYLDREYEPPNGLMVLGSAVGAAEAHADQAIIDGAERPGIEDVVDSFSDEWDERVEREDVVWRDETPGALKDTGTAVVQAFEQSVAPTYTPVSVEREFEVRFEGCEWAITGYLDMEQDDGVVADRKVKGRRLSLNEAANDIQPTTYLLARRAEGNPAPAFHFHTGVRTKTPYAEVVPTLRTDRQLDNFADRLLLIAAEINWRLENDVWQGAAPGSWKCSEKFCGYWRSCPLGGAR